MSESLESRPGSVFWIIAGAALAWNLLGVAIYYRTVTATRESLAGDFTPEQIELMVSAPVWVTSAYAIAVFGGAIGSVLLLLRKSLAVPVFALSLAGILVQNFHGFVLADGLAVWGASAAVLPAIVIVIGIALLLYARGAKASGWLD